MQSISHRWARGAATSLCTVFLAIGLTACGGNDEPPPPADPNFALKPGAKVLNAANARLLAQDDVSLTVAGDGASGLQAGNIVISTLGQGALRRVTSIAPLPGGGLYLTTEQAALTDAFERFNLAFNRSLTANDLGSSFDTGEPGLELKWTSPAAVSEKPTSVNAAASVDGPSLTLGFKKWEVGASTGFEIDGTASFKLQPDFKVDLVPVTGKLLPVLTYRAALSPAYSHQYTVSSKYGGSISIKKDKEIPLRPIVLASPPVTIVPYIVVSASAGGTAAGKFSATSTGSVNGSAWVERDVTRKVDVGHSFQPLMTGRFESVEAAIGADITPARVSLEFRIYNVGGPQFALAASANAEGSYMKDGLTGAEGIHASIDGSLKFTAGVGGNIGFVSKLFSDAEGSFTLVSKDFLLYEGNIFDGFFPFTGAGNITVFDNGSSADDIFEVSLDGTVLGRTAKGGSGQFRIGSLRPGAHQLRVLTIEDDDPPGTWAVNLSNGVTFSDGSRARSGQLPLGQAVVLPIVVPGS